MSSEYTAVSGGYRAFPDVPRRNWLQEQVEIPLLLAAISVPADARILEVGCGRGIALPVFQRLCRPRSLIGIDVDDRLLALARERLEASGSRATLRHCDVREMPFPDASFDVIVDFGTCYHITRPDLALQEIGRVLSPGGRFIYETGFSQLLSHPWRAFGRSLPWQAAPMLRLNKRRLLWNERRKT